MPTAKRRYSITETADLAEALEEVRRLFPLQASESSVLTELVILGAKHKLADSERRRALRERLLERMRRGDAFDEEAAYGLKAEGWTPHVTDE